MTDDPKVRPEDRVDAYGDALFHFALARVKDRAVAEDLVQETFLAAVRSRERFQGRSTEKTWLFGILKHKVIDHFRRRRAAAPATGFADGKDPVEAMFEGRGGWVTPPATGAPTRHRPRRPGSSWIISTVLCPNCPPGPRTPSSTGKSTG